MIDYRKLGEGPTQEYFPLNQIDHKIISADEIEEAKQVLIAQMSRPSRPMSARPPPPKQRTAIVRPDTVKPSREFLQEIDDNDEFLVTKMIDDHPKPVNAV